MFGKSYLEDHPKGHTNHTEGVFHTPNPCVKFCTYSTKTSRMIYIVYKKIYIMNEYDNIIQGNVTIIGWCHDHTTKEVVITTSFAAVHMIWWLQHIKWWATNDAMMIRSSGEHVITNDKPSWSQHVNFVLLSPHPEFEHLDWTIYQVY